MTGVTDSIEHEVISIVTDLIVDWELDPDLVVTADTLLAGDLGFTSIDLVAFISAIEDRWQRRDWPYEQLLLRDGNYVGDLTVAEVASFLRREARCE